MSKSNLSEKNLITWVVLTLALIFSLFLQGAIPFLATPTLGQAVWTTGFSQSFINESIFNIYARNFGTPQPAAIAFGLAGAWPAAIFMKLGLQAADAYSAMIALWIIIAFISAFSIAQYFSVHRLLAVFAALCWTTMPYIIRHAGYSMLSAGIALLSLYFLTALKVFDPIGFETIKKNKARGLWILLYPFVCCISVFMDGYSFMMFAVGSSILGAWIFLSESKRRKQLAIFQFPLHILSFTIAYFLYSFYIGKLQFEASPIDFFRGWGVDLTFLFVPTKGIHWLPDFIGWSALRSSKIFFGDSSVWKTSFSIPVIIGAIWAVLNVSKKKGLITGLALISLFGFYMSLGPSLKFNSNKPDGEKLGGMMERKYALAPTGSALLSENVPGFKNFRASYRWGALGVFGAWVIIVVGMSAENRKKTIIGAAIFIGLITILNLPNLSEIWKGYKDNRIMFLKIESDLINDSREVFSKGEHVAFLPWRNDFLVNYFASRLDIISFNIGGDKNYREAWKHWPKTMRSFPKSCVDQYFADRILIMLARNEAEAIVLPYIDMLLAAHHWPPSIKFKKELEPKIVQLENSGFVETANNDFYAVVRLKPEFEDIVNEKLEILIRKSTCMPPYCLRQDEFNASTPSKVGMVQGGKLVSTGNAGFIHYGPYVPMVAGRYRLTIYGNGTLSESAWSDVVSGKGRVKYAKFPLKSDINNKKGILSEGVVEISSSVQDIEIRVYIGAEDRLTLEGYEFTTVQ